MSDFGQLIQACVASGIVLSSLCAMLFVPVLLWVAVRRLAPSIIAMNNDPAWQAPIAAIAAALPGLAFGVLAIEALITGSNSRCLMYFSGRILFGVAILLTILAFVRALARAAQQHAEVRALFSRSSAPTERLAEIGNELGLPVRSLPDDATFCALAGVIRPTAFVSARTESSLSNDELRAALLHERAHRSRYDQILIALLAFATDLLPLPVGDLTASYQHARELAADQAAAQETDAIYVAAAIIGTLRGQSVSLASALSTEPGIVHTRLDALLNQRPSKILRSPRIALASSLALLTLLATSTAIASLIVSAACAQLASM